MLVPASALACSPAFNPTIAELGQEQVVLLGETGVPAPGGRLFHVERAWNGDVPTSPIVIAFKEGEPIGDCSYPVAAGTRLVIAPWREPDGTLSANLGTLQADPLSVDGTRYLAETAQLFGSGTVPVAAVPEDDPPAGRRWSWSRPSVPPPLRQGWSCGGAGERAATPSGPPGDEHRAWRVRAGQFRATEPRTRRLSRREPP